MTVITEEKSQILNLIKSCNEFIDGKFILADSKISKILKDIADSKDVFNLLSECMLNFNFEKEFARAKVKLPTRPGYFKMPEEKYKLMPMVFCILVDIDSRKLDLSMFLKNYFKGTDDKTTEFENFAAVVIKPFRNAISEVYNLPLTINERVQMSKDAQSESVEQKPELEEVNMEVEEETKQSEEDEIFTKLDKITQEIKSCIHSDRKIKPDLRDEANIILSGITRALELRDLKILNALLIGFDYAAGQLKCIKFIYKEFKQCLIDYYDSLRK